MPEIAPRTVMAIVAVAGVVVGGGLIYAGWRFNKENRPPGPKRGSDFLPRVTKGHVVCPADEGRIGVSPARVRPNDFVILKLATADDRFFEHTWGRVLDVAEDRMRVALTGTMAEQGLRPLDERHGFEPGEMLELDRGCAYDLYDQSTPRDYAVLCGVFLADLGYEGIPAGVLTLKQGDLVTIVVGNPPVTAAALPGKIWNEEIRVSVITTGPTGDIVRALVWDDPEQTELHGLKTFSKVEFTKDCIVEV